jgi:methylenetetrahydrofolate dehydrogenase (NADP+)/methenyltetrahydrofolate cyclohydrolase
MHIINGREISQKIEKNLKTYFQSLIKKPKIKILLANNDAPSRTYTSLKKRKADELGVHCEVIQFDENISASEIINYINFETKTSDGIVVQLPLFNHLEAYRNDILNSIPKNLDIDCLSNESLSLIFASANETVLLPATAQAVLECLNEINYRDLTGKNILLINNSNLIGIPLSIYFSNKQATVTIANKFSTNLTELTKQADIIISATGQTGIIHSHMIKQNSVLIDVTSVKKNEKVTGDVVLDEDMLNIDGFCTPVPGGVGPLTVICLFSNLQKCLLKKEAAWKI